VIQPWMSNRKTLPTPNHRRRAHNTPVLASKNTARGCPAGGTPDPWGSDKAHPHSASHSARRRSSGACPRSCKRIPPEQGPGPSAAENSLTSSGLTTCSRNSAQAAFTGPPASSAAAFTPAARKPRRQLPLNPTIRPFAGNNLGRQPSASAPSGAPEGEAQGIPKKLAAFTGAGRRQIGRANANALAAEGNASEGHGAGGVIGIGGNPHPDIAGEDW
jgi:hypothetical protein